LNTKTVTVEGIGPVTFPRRRNSNRISMRVKSDGSISVNYPWHASFSEALKFLNSNTDWVSKHQKKREENRKLFNFGDNLQTRFHSISIHPTEKPKGYANISKDKVVICVPAERDIASEPIQEFIRNVISEVYRREAKLILPNRVEELAKHFDFKYQKVFVKKLKSKWGSCSSTGNINLNVFLMTLPDHLVDFIILHELAHTREHNHGDGFWLLLNKVTGGKAHLLDKEVKKFNSSIFR
jgi:predicted metal-dependent hydrolase